MKILGIETSCDETAIAVLNITPQWIRQTHRGEFIEPPTRGEEITVLSNVISSQVKLHAKFGGVVPNLAAREHEKNLPHVFKSALKKSKLKMSDIDLIAVTRGPGLSPSLWRGINFAKKISEKYKKPIIGVNHLEGHIYSNWLKPVGEFSIFPDGKAIEDPRQSWDNFSRLAGSRRAGQFSKKIFPILNLIVSGGHTELVLMENYGKYKVIGETLDDAIGEAFDKVARLLGLGYPGGPLISRIAEKGNPDRYPLPSPMINSKDYNFSYSGLKTAVLYLLRDLKISPSNSSGRISAKQKFDIAASFQKAAIGSLIKKTLKAAKEYGVDSIMLSGGVSANTLLRFEFKKLAEENGLRYSRPQLEYTGDNAAMIAVAGYFNYS